MTTATNIVGTGAHTYEFDRNWAQLPDGIPMPAAAVFGDDEDQIYCFNRNPEHPIMIFDREGKFVKSWGAGMFEFPHAIIIDQWGYVWLVDRNMGQIFKLTKDGELVMTIGDRGFRSDTGANNEAFDSNSWHQVVRGAEPFNMPAGIALNDAGEIYIADGYGNARVHKFTATGELIFSWGEPGSGPGQFNLPHGAWINREGQLLIADRENDRVQVFNQDGTHISDWPSKLIGPAVICLDDEGVGYVAEHNGGMLSILDQEGQRLAQWGDLTHRSCHGVWVDSHKDLYVVEPYEGSTGRTVVKYTRKG